MLTNGNQKQDLGLAANASNEITFSSNGLQVEEGQIEELVIDFDLRKAIKRDDQNGSTDYAFSDGQFELKGSLQVDVLAGLSLQSVSISSQASATLNVTVQGILPL